MKLWFPQYFEAKSRFLSYTVVAKAFRDAGHEICPTESGCDATLFSMCDAMEYRDLMAMRKRTRLPLLVGGSFAFNFWAVKLWADGVWVGEVYEMAECKTLNEILASPHCYTGGDVLPVSSLRIDWEKVPIAQIKKGSCYYWGGTGCKNKCRFCFTSWTHAHSVNTRERIQRAREICKARGVSLMISSNEYDNDPGAKTFDMLLKDYVKTPVAANMVRCGVEFATDETRCRMGKPVTFEDMFRALQKAERERVILKWFHICGYDRKEDWDSYIEKVCQMGERVKYSRLLQLEFNNLQYQNYTPLYAERKSIDPSRYATHDDVNGWNRRLRMSFRSVLVGQPSTFQRAASRMGVELSTDAKQAQFWAGMMVDPNKKMTPEQAYKLLFDTGVLDTPPLKLNPLNGVITIHEPWR